MKKTLLMLTLAILWLCSCSPAAARLGGDTPWMAGLSAQGARQSTLTDWRRPGKITPTQANVPYYAEAPGVKSISTSLDIYTVEGWKDHPIMIYVHGGGWSKGDKAQVLYKPEAFNDAGYVFVSVNYRLLPEADLSLQAQDIARAIAWTGEHAGEFGGGERITLMGHSAGAHLVSLVGSDATYLEAEGLSLKTLSGVVSLDSQAYDIPALMHSMRGSFMLGGRIYRQAFGSDPKVWEKLSPITHIAPGNGTPPFLVAYSGSGAGRINFSKLFVQRLLEAGVEAELLPATDKTHAQINSEIGLPNDPVTKAIFAFLEQVAYNN